VAVAIAIRTINQGARGREPTVNQEDSALAATALRNWDGLSTKRVIIGQVLQMSDTRHGNRVCPPLPDISALPMLSPAFDDEIIELLQSCKVGIEVKAATPLT
jgi:hypothetical protein